MASPSAPIRFYESLTWDDLNVTFGASTVQRGRTYQRQGAVSRLGQTANAQLVAWVRGAERYAAVVEIKSGELQGRCSCPVGQNCKHVVAVVLEYLEYVKQGEPIPLVEDDDPRLKLAAQSKFPGSQPATTTGDAWEEAGAVANDDGEKGERGGEDGNEGNCTDGTRAALHSHGTAGDAGKAPKSGKRRAVSVALVQFLEKQSYEALRAWLLELAETTPQVHQWLEDRRRAAESSLKELIAEARTALYEASAEPGWSNPWTGEGYAPDYSRFRNLLQILLEQGVADAVLELGEELLEVGRAQVAESQDEGETAAEIIACLNVVAQALPQSKKKSPAEQILWAVNARLHDDYNLFSSLDPFWSREFPCEVWSEVADALLRRLKPTKRKKVDDFLARQERDKLGRYLILALERAGRNEEILPLCEREAPVTGAYEPLVERLLGAQRMDVAVAWIRRGIEATQEQYPGIANRLRAKLRELRREQGDWKSVAADWAQEFFQSPSVPAFEELMSAAEKAQCRPEVEAAARYFLETGSPPQTRPRKVRNQTIPAWPLPAPETPAEGPTRYGHREQPPYYQVLIDLALKENDLQAALRWYDEAKRKNRPLWGLEATIADATAKIAPERSLAFWRTEVERQVAQANPSAYEVAARYLRKIRGLLRTLGREQDFQSYLEQLRQEHRRKRRLTEILDGLEGRPIVQS